MNNYCRCCGQKLLENINYCPTCGTKVLKNRANTENNQLVEDNSIIESKENEPQETKEEKKDDPKIEKIIFYVGTILLLITVALFLEKQFNLESNIPFEVMDIIKIASPGIIILNTIILTYAKINYPKSIRTKILFYLNAAIIGYIIIRIIIGLIAVFWIFALCFL